VIACDADPERLKTVREHHPDVDTTSDFTTILNDSKVNAIVLATPVITHFSLASQSLKAGKHTFVEKPLALQSEEAQQLITLADQHRCQLMVDHLLEYHPAVEHLKQLIAAGELGEIFYLYSQRLNFGIVRTEENALWSLGVHDMSVMLHLVGQDPHTVWAQGMDCLQKGIEDMTLVTLEFPQGLRAHIYLSWLDPQKVRKFVVIGSRKMAIFDDLAAKKLVLSDKRVHRQGKRLSLHDGGASPVPLEDKEPLRTACEHFLHCIERHVPPRSDGRDGLRVVRVLEAAQRSLDQEGQAVCLTEVKKR